MHAVIDACLALRRDHAMTAEQIAEIVISGDQLLLDRGDRAVTNERDARVSIHHCAAVSLLFGAAGLKEFSEVTVRDPAVVALRARTRAVLDAGSPRGAATATVRTVDGRVLTSTVPHAKGSTELPLSDAEIEVKVRDLAGYGDFRGSIDAVIAAVWQLHTMATIAPLVALLGNRRP
jgi:2-methylcitrate dehydratase PrpD